MNAPVRFSTVVHVSSVLAGLVATSTIGCLAHDAGLEAGAGDAALTASGGSRIAVGSGTPVSSSGLKVVDITTAGYAAYAILSDGTVRGIGQDPYFGQLSDLTTLDPLAQATPLPGLSGVTSISGFFGYAAALGRNGLEIWADAYEFRTDPSAAPTTGALPPTVLASASAKPIVAFGGAGPFCAIAETSPADAEVQCWGFASVDATSSTLSSSGDLLANPPQIVTPAIAGLTFGPVVQVTAGTLQACAIDAQGVTICWGDDRGGPFGDGKMGGPSSGFTRGYPSLTLKQLAFANAQAASCALTTDGGVWCAGFMGLQVDSAAPRQVLGDVVSNVAQISIGTAEEGSGTGSALYALEDDGSVWYWAFDDATPFKITALPSPATKVSSGLLMTCALLTDDSVWCWVGAPATDNVFKVAF